LSDISAVVTTFKGNRFVKICVGLIQPTELDFASFQNTFPFDKKKRNRINTGPLKPLKTYSLKFK
jgi:hypothetical protein